MQIEEILNYATDEERKALAEMLGSWSDSPDALIKKLQNQTLNVFQWVAGSTPTYEEIVVRAASKFDISRRLFETDEDLERRLIRSVCHNALLAMNPEQRKKYEINLLPHAVGAGGILVSQASGFGIYQMASTVVGALTAAAGLKLPFLAYMAMSKAISIAIGPVGWLGLGIGALHTITKPNYERVTAGIAHISMIRQRLNPSWEWRGYSKTEILRKVLKTLALLAVAAWPIWIMLQIAD